jgi:uncharacterized protein YndB with AHSA1/START domain
VPRKIEVEIDIAATPAQVWQVLQDVERWPEWTSSMTSVKRLDSGAFRLGSEVRIRQPQLPQMVWRVTRIDAARGFVWETRSWGALTMAEHWISPNGNGSKVVLVVQQSGLLVPLFWPWISKLTRHNMELEAEGLKRRSEAQAADRGAA